MKVDPSILKFVRSLSTQRFQDHYRTTWKDATDIYAYYRTDRKFGRKTIGVTDDVRQHRYPEPELIPVGAGERQLRDIAARLTVRQITMAESSGGRVGDCYEAAVNYMTSHGTLGPAFMRGGKPGNPDLILVHGEVTGQGKLHGVRYGHAWIEDGNNVIDPSNGRTVEMTKTTYYALGRIMPPFTRKPKNIHTYTAEEVRLMVVKHEHYGPWELKTSTGL